MSPVMISSPTIVNTLSDIIHWMLDKSTFKWMLIIDVGGFFGEFEDGEWIVLPSLRKGLNLTSLADGYGMTLHCCAL